MCKWYLYDENMELDLATWPRIVELFSLNIEELLFIESWN